MVLQLKTPPEKHSSPCDRRVANASRMERVSAARQSDKMDFLKSVDVASGGRGKLTLPRAYPHGREAGRTHNRVDFTDRPLWREEVGARPGTVSD